MGGFHSICRITDGEPIEDQQNLLIIGKKNCIKIPAMNNRYSMIQAAAYGDLSRIKSLLESGVNVNTRDSMNRTALHLACAEGHSHIVRFLVEHGSCLKIKDRHGYTPLQDAVRNGHKEVIEIMILAGAQCSTETIAEMEARLCGYAFSGNLNEVEKMIRDGTSPSCADYLGNSPLHLAVQQKKHEMVVYLLSIKAEINCKNMKGDTPLSIALRNQDHCLADILIKAGSIYSCTGFQQSSDADSCLKLGIDLKSGRAERAPFDSIAFQSIGCASFAVLLSCPAPIARAVLNNKEIQPLSRSIVSLFFSDIVGFTELSSQLTADKVSSLLAALIKVTALVSVDRASPLLSKAKETKILCDPI